MINQRSNICKAWSDEIVVEDLICSNFSAIESDSFWCDNDLDSFLFLKLSCVSSISFSFDIERFSRYWLKISKVILSSFFSLKTIFWYFRTLSMIETTSHKFLIRSMWKSFKTKSITKNSNKNDFFSLLFLLQSRRFRRKICLMTKDSSYSSHKNSKHRFLWQLFHQETLSFFFEQIRIFLNSRKQTIS
jgi:hypothetical protein